MIVPNKAQPFVVLGTVTSNEDGLVLITIPAPMSDTMRVRRWKSETEEHFKAEWPVGREVKIEVNAGYGGPR